MPALVREAVSEEILLPEQIVGKMVQVAKLCFDERYALSLGGSLSMTDEGIWTSSEDHDLANLVLAGCGLPDLVEGVSYFWKYEARDVSMAKSLFLLALLFGWSATLIDLNQNLQVSVDNDSCLTVSRVGNLNANLTEDIKVLLAGRRIASVESAS